jgi:DNA-binding response OmpR family regulator
MKCALLLETNQRERHRMTKILEWLGYVAAPVQTPEEAINVADAISFDLIVTCTSRKPSDRRSLTSELKRLAPASTIVLVTEKRQEYEDVKAGALPDVSAALKRPPSMEELRRIVQFGVDGCGLQAAGVPAHRERRRRPMGGPTPRPTS